jgi:hypothetical protein
VFFPAGEYIERKEVPYPNHLSRVDYLEDVHVKIYGDHMYSENDELFVKYVEERDSILLQPVEVETRPLTPKLQQSMHAGEQNLPMSKENFLTPSEEKMFERLLEGHATQGLSFVRPLSE